MGGVAGMAEDRTDGQTARQAGERHTEDERLLNRRDDPRAAAFTHTDPWRVFRILGEFVEGFDRLAAIGPSVSVFGSARVKPSDPMYAEAENLARQLVHAGFGVITGGGPGLMEAAQRPDRSLRLGILAWAHRLDESHNARRRKNHRG